MKKVLLSVCMAIAAMNVSAQNLTVIAEKTLPMGNKMQILKDADGRLTRRLVKPEGYKAAAATAPIKAAADDIETYYEGFENYRTNFGMDWIPVDWSEINTPENIPTDDQLAHNVNMSWYVYESSNFYQEMTTDGTKEAFIHFGYESDTYGLTAAAQDEWLVSPEITLASNETLSFLLQADYMSVYNCKEFDWSQIKYPEPREVVNTMKVMVSEDEGKNWTEVWDLAKNVTDKLTDRQCYDASDLKIRPQEVDLSAYAGKTVQVAFRYWRKEGDWMGNSMILDGIHITHPSPAGIDNVKANGSQNAAAEYFTVNGMRVSNVKPATKGLYIERKNGVARKVVVK